jgi:hypothetical protein
MMERRRRTERNQTPWHIAKRMTTTTTTIALLLLISTITLPCRTTTGFQMGMEYKPPVKSSVQKLYSQRFPSHRSSVDDAGTSKSAFAVGQHAPTPVSFERRMRDLVLASSQQQRLPARTLDAPTTTTTRPTNVVPIETLQEYKTVVGDERNKVVVVRFHASYCKVRSFFDSRIDISRSAAVVGCFDDSLVLNVFVCACVMCVCFFQHGRHVSPWLLISITWQRYIPT